MSLHAPQAHGTGSAGLESGTQLTKHSTLAHLAATLARRTGLLGASEQLEAQGHQLFGVVLQQEEGDDGEDPAAPDVHPERGRALRNVRHGPPAQAAAAAITTTVTTTISRRAVTRIGGGGAGHKPH